MNCGVALMTKKDSDKTLAKNLAKNPYLDFDTDVVEHLASLTPDTPDMRRVGKQAWLRLALTEAMIAARKAAGMTQKDVAEALGVSQSWVSKLESANYDHQLESVVSHLDAVGAELMLTVKVGDKVIPVARETESDVSSKTPVLH
jgi:DNA-binding XRE family transcriptional regulator